MCMDFNAHNSKQLKEWLSETNEYLSCIIIGSSGQGKTSFYESNIDNNSSIIKIPFEDFDSHNELIKFVTNTLNKKSISCMCKDYTKVILFDDVDILMNQNRFSNAYLYKLVSTNKNKKHKFLFTILSTEEKKLGDLSKNALIIRLNNPSYDDYQSMFPSFNKERLLEICETNRYNLRSVVKEINSRIGNIESVRFFEMNVYDRVNILIKEKITDLKTIKESLSTDSNLVTYMLYDNWFTQSLILHPTTVLKISSTILSCFCQTSSLEDFAYLHMDPMLADIINLIRCYTITSTLKQLTHKSQAKLPVKYTRVSLRTSQHYVNVKRNIEFQHESAMTDMNMILSAEVHFANKEKEKIKKTVLSSYVNNICLRKRNKKKEV